MMLCTVRYAWIVKVNHLYYIVYVFGNAMFLFIDIGDLSHVCVWLVS